MTKTRTNLLTIALGLAAAIALGGWTPYGDMHDLASTPLPACATEDAVSCHWDAATQGNGQGRSFDAHADGTITYTD